MAVPPGFRPKLTASQVSNYKRLYDQQPDKFDENTVQAIEQHAEYYKLPFSKSNKTFLKQARSAVGQAGAGFVEGFTTFGGGGPQPENDVEAIARNLGHLAGFVGYVPTIGMKRLGLNRLAETLKALKGQSLPMQLATGAQKRAAKTVRPIFEKAIEGREASKSAALRFLQKDTTQDVVGGAFHLGVASAVSSWKGGVDQMLEGLIFGAGAGGAFRTLGNAVKTGNETADKTIRGLAGSLFQGLPSSVRGDTTPQQVYNYVLGAYFGANESPISARQSKLHIAKMRQTTDPVTGKLGVSDPELVPGFKNYSKETQDLIVKKVKEEMSPDDPAFQYEVAEAGQVPELNRKQQEIENFNIKRKADIQELDAQKGLNRGFAGEELVEINKLREDVDPQIVPEKLTRNAKEFVDDFITTKDINENIKIASEIDTKWNELVNKNMETKVNPANEMIEFVNSKYGERIAETLEGGAGERFWINLGHRKLREMPVRRLSLVNGKIEELAWDKSMATMSRAGNRKHLVHEPKIMETIYNKDYQGEKPGTSYAVLDNVIYKTRTGLRELTIPEYQRYLERMYQDFAGMKYPEAVTKAQQRVTGELSNALKERYKKDFYYYSGKGDSENLYFVKMHPLTPKKTEDINNAFNKSLSTIIRSEAVELKDKRLFRTRVKEDREAFVAKYTDPALKKEYRMSKEEAIEIYNRSYLSNILYDIRINGFQTSIDNKGVIQNLDKVLGTGYINTAKDFNKRAQILLTNGYSADPLQTKKFIEKFSKQTLEELFEKKQPADTFSFYLVKDGIGRELIKDIVVGKTPNSLTVPSTDGAIIAPEYVIKALNRQAGIPEEGGVNKSFFLSRNSTDGGLLGKYMIFPASPKLEAYMTRKKIQFIVPKSAAKAMGERIKHMGEYTYENNQPSIKNAKKFYIPIQDIKVILSETTSSKFVEPKKIPKQLWTNYSPYAFFNSKDTPFREQKQYQIEMQRIFDDMYNDLITQEVNGKKEFNDKIDILMNDPVKNEALVPELIKNIDKIGLKNLLDAIKMPGNEKFANEAYRKIHRLNDDIVNEMYAEGELTSRDLEIQRTNSGDYRSVNERILSLVDNSLAGFLHKYPRDYRMAVMRNYFIDRITRPTVENSAAARMRPYEIGMSRDMITKDLEVRDDVFYLGNQFKDMNINISGIKSIKGKNIRLGDLWGKHKDNPEAKELLEALVVRVPMDSMSGAQVLKFKGFTNTNDYGVLLHGRSMEALGGADLDGDKAFVFFGGKNPDGSGAGFKSDWKNMYRWSKNEYVKNGVEQDAKLAIDPTTKNQTYSDQLAFTETSENGIYKDIIQDRTKNPGLQYSPNVRRDISEAAAQGRARLGGAVTQSAYLRAAYAAIRNSNEGYFDYTRKVGKGTRTIRIIPKTDNLNLEAFRGRTRASIGLSSDPMNEAGLNWTSSKLLKLQADNLFTYQVLKKNKDGKMVVDKKAKITDADKLNLNIQSPVKVAMEVNNALYGKNFTTGNHHTMWEIMGKLNSVDRPKSGFYYSNNRNTFLPRIGYELRKFDWNDSVIRRISYKRIQELYKEHNANTSELNIITEALGRGSAKVPESDIVKFVYGNELHNYSTALQLSRIKNNKKLFTNSRIAKNYPNADKDDVSRSLAIKDVVSKAEDFIVKDLSDIASYKDIKKYIKDISKKDIEKISKLVDERKKNSYLMQKQDRTPEMTKSKMEDFGDVQTKARTQFETDVLIKQDRDGLSPQGKKLYDSLFLSSIWRGKIDVAKRLKDKTDPNIKETADTILDASFKTGLSKLGFASKEIPDVAVKSNLNEYQKLFDYSIERIDPKQTSKNIEVSNKIDEKIGGVSAVEDPYKNEANGKYVDELAPFEGLYKGKVFGKKEKAIVELKNHLDHYPNLLGKKFNGFIRSVTNKDINRLTLEDVEMVNRYLKEAREGTWWSNILGKPNKEIRSWYNFMFPRTIDTDVMRREIKLVQQRMPVETKEGMRIRNVQAPEGMMTKLQSVIHEAQQQGTQRFEVENNKWLEKINPYIDGIPEGRDLFRYAVRKRELGVVPYISEQVSRKEKPFVYNEFSKEYINKFNELQKEINWKKLKDQKFTVLLGKDTVRLTGEQVVNRLNNIITDQYRLVSKWISGRIDPDLDLPNNTIFERDYGRLSEGQSIKKFTEKYYKSLLDGKPIDMTVGLDGLQLLSHNQLLGLSRNPEIKKVLRDQAPTPTRFIPFESYWTHFGSQNPKEATKRLNDIIEKISKDTTIDKASREKEIAKQIYHFRQLTNDLQVTSELTTKYALFEEAIQKIADKGKLNKNELNKLLKAPRIGSQQKRDAHIPGWSVEPEIMSQYMKNVIDASYKQAAHIIARSDIYKFRQEFFKKTKDADLTQRWSDFYTMFAQDAVGYPQQIPERILNDPKMGIKGTPYSWVNDTAVLNFVNKVRKKLGINEKYNVDESLKDFDFNTLSKWSNLEAKYQLATLLAHPKSAVANLYGGSTQTLISTGFKHFRNARDPKYLSTFVNEKFKNKEAVTEWVKSLGVVEDFLLYEAGFNPKFREKNYKDFLSESVSLIKKDFNTSDQTLRSIAAKYKISENAFNKAAWFMRVPERTLRRDAFMAHYLQAREKFAGAIQKYDDPILIKMAKEGVKSTQFLYSAPFRPAFARSAMGKALTRFQLWAWNSVRFRGDIIKEARIRGFKEGTMEYDRFKRLAALDLLMFGLANTFMYSIFENTLPQPWSWAQDLADWSFGSETERSRAFFGQWPQGVAPLQAITPPIARPLPGLFKAIVEDDYSTLGGYYAWSMLPFGRVGYDIFGNVLQGNKGGLIQNPYRFVEKLTGIPYQQIPRELEKYNDDEMLRPSFIK